MPRRSPIIVTHAFNPRPGLTRIMTSLRLRVFAVFALGYFVSYLFRGVNLGFTPFLSHQMGLTATDLGTLTSLYFLGLPTINEYKLRCVA